MMHKLSDSLLVVEWPQKNKRESVGRFCEDSDVRFKLTNLCRKPFLNFNANGHVIYNVELPPGEHELICLYPSEITEEIAEGLVETISNWHMKGFKNYLSEDSVYTYAKASLASLIASKGLQDKNLCLIEIIK